MTPKFDPHDVTSTVRFDDPINTSHIQGLNVLVTGGANGLGAAITHRLCAEGAQVVIADFQREAGDKIEKALTSHGFKAKYVYTDVTKWDSQVNAFKTAIKQSPRQRLDLVIACAGTPGIPLPLHDKISLDEDPPAPPMTTIDVTLTGVYFTACLAVHYFRLPPTGSLQNSRKQQIIFMGSLAGYIEVPPVADYNAAKFGVRGLWKALRKEVRDMNIRTNMIAPTFMPTVMVQQVSKALEEKGAKLGKIEDVVQAAMRLAADDDIDGRAIACGGNGSFDLRDDYEGLDAGTETLEHFKTGAFGSGMHNFKDVLGGRSW